MPDRQEVLEVARQHGTTVAAEWAGISPATVVAWRKRHDGYQRGRGHPTRAEKAAMSIRPDCPCARCRAARGVRFPRLTPGQQRLVEANLRLVPFFLKKWRVAPEHFEDAHQDGLLGLMRAAQLFEPERGFQFSTFAQHQIRAAIQRGRARFEGRNFRRDNNGFTPRINAPWDGRPASLDATINEEGATLLHFLVAPEDPAVAAVEHRDELTHMVRAIAAICRDDLDRDAVAWMAGTLTSDEVARRHGVTRATVRNRAESLRSRLRHPVMRRRLGLERTPSATRRSA